MWRALLIPVAALGGPAAHYLSELPFEGLHILERDRRPDDPTASEEDVRQYNVYTEGQASARPMRVLASWTSMAEARAVLTEALAIPPPEPYQNDWALFTAQGRRLETAEALDAEDVAFLLLVGQWMWPAVREGFVHIADNVIGDQPLRLRTLSLRPVVFLVEKFLTNENTDDIIEAAKQGGMRVSEGVLQTKELAQKKKHSEFRTSNQAWLTPQGHGKKTTVLIETLDARVANLTRVPRSHQEHSQILRYERGQYYHGHMDWSELELYAGQEHIWTNAHYGWKDRMITVFWYLTDVKEGGETIFPKQGQPVCPNFQRTCEGSSEPDMASCDAPLKVKPKRGTVILWYNFHPSGRGDRNALHAGCPPGLNDTKWSANKWVHTKPLDIAPAKWDPKHPALDRYGWDKKPDPNACNVEFWSEYADPIEIHWLSPDGSSVRLAGLVSGQRSTQNSFIGHNFFVTSKGSFAKDIPPRKSPTITCRKGGDNIYTIDSDFVIKGGSKEELEKEKKDSDKLGSDQAQHPNACSIELWSEYADPFEVYWLSPDGPPVKLADVAPGASQNLNSFIGHKFFVESGGRKSPTIKCRKRSDNIYTIGRDFNLEEGSGEL